MDDFKCYQNKKIKNYFFNRSLKHILCLLSITIYQHANPLTKKTTEFYHPIGYYNLSLKISQQVNLRRTFCKLYSRHHIIISTILLLFL